MIIFIIRAKTFRVAMLPCYRGFWASAVDVRSDLISFMNFCHMGEFVVEGFFFLEVVTFFVTLRADLEDYFKGKT